MEETLPARAKSGNASVHLNTFFFFLAMVDFVFSSFTLLLTYYFCLGMLSLLTEIPDECQPGRIIRLVL